MALDHSNYYHVGWSAYAVINNERVDIAGFNIRYELDAIPQATIYPVVGREPSTDREARSFQVILNAQPYSRVQIYINADPLAGDSPSDTPGFLYRTDQLVFDGYYIGVGYEESRNPAGGSVQVTADALGWLAGLIGTSGQTARNTVKGPGSFADLCNVGLPGASNPNAIIDTRNAFVAGPTAAVSDLWIEFIKPLFDAIINTESVWGGDDNASANEALGRMDAAPFGTQLSPNTLPLELESGAIVPPNVFGKWVAANVAKDVFYNWRSGTLWDALKRAANSFLFTIVPLIDTASCCPVFGALGGDPFATITPDEYHSINLQARTPALITKAVVTGTIGTANSPYSPTSRIGGVIGLFSSEDAWAGPLFPVRGQTIQFKAPPWLEAEVSVGSLTRDSLGSANGVPDAVNPSAFTQQPETDYQEVYNNYRTSDMGDRYAETLLKNLMLLPRQGSLAGRFRLDVAPGSTVGVQVIGDRFSRENADPSFVFGLVNAVTLGMNAGTAGGNGFAETRFDIQFLRTGQEHTGYGSFIVADRHPIYQVPYLGSSLFTQ